MEHHPVVEQIKNLLKQNKAWFESFEHEPVTTSEDAAKIRTGYDLHQGTKALIIRCKNKSKEKKFVMVVVPGDRKFDSAKLKNIFGLSDIRFATEEEVSTLTSGVQRGGVPPFGNLFNLPIYADSAIFKNEKVIFNAGDRSVSIGMYSKDYQLITNSTIGDISCEK